MDKQDLRVRKTIQQIDNALLAILRKTSFDRVTVDMLCREAMINRSTFYRYYEDKYDLLNKYTDRILAEFRACVKVDFVQATVFNVNDPVYQKNFLELLNHIYEHREIYLTLANGSAGRDIWDEMSVIIQENILRELQKDSKIPPENERYIRLYARLFSSDLMAMILWWFDCDGEVSADDIKALMTANMKDGSFKTFKGYL